MNHRSHAPISVSWLAILFITLLAFGLRLWRLGNVPPGWRDDELINSLVISQKVLDGDWAVYYPDASGHEALYHVLNAMMLGVFGPNNFGIRWLSVILGTLTVPATYLIGRRLFGSTAGLIAAGTLTFSFWALMYSRIGLRHVLLPLLTAMAFYFFWQGLRASPADTRSHGSHRNFLLTAVFTGLGFYTYFASRGVPLILAAFCGYLWLTHPALFKRHRRGFLLMFGISALMAIPLLITLARQPESEARVVELAVPLVEARAGRFDLLWDHFLITMGMFHNEGDGEWLYNIPHRPIFGPFVALSFWAGILIALLYALLPLLAPLVNSFSSNKIDTFRSTWLSLAAAFSLIWWLVGISPAFVSVPPASLGHTILAQPIVFIIAALPLERWASYKLAKENPFRWKRLLPIGAIGLALVVSIAWRDLNSYFLVWPERGMVRFLYRAEIRQVASYLNDESELVDFGITGLLAGPWDQMALMIDLDEARANDVRPRWYHPERVLLLQPAISFSDYPAVTTSVITPFTGDITPVSGIESIGGYSLNKVTKTIDETGSRICFRNGLCWLSAVYDDQTQELDLIWSADRVLDLPPKPLTSNPPPPGVYAGPRLLAFSQLQDSRGRFLVADDGLWIDPTTLQAGDVFLQRHRLVAPASSAPATAVFGLYDPMTGERILTEDGQDHIRIEIGE